jgi:hypothetical protein
MCGQGGMRVLGGFQNNKSKERKMSLGSSLVAGDFVDCGIVDVDIPTVCKKWDSRFSISSWHDRDFRLFAKRKNGKSYLFKFSISFDQAHEIITKLNLDCVACETFKNAKLYRITSLPAPPQACT